MSRTVKAAQYLQIALDIATRIARGELAEGSRIYGRSVMSSEYSVSPETIRRALRLLADMKVVEVKPQSGAVVLSADSARRYIERFGASVNTQALQARIQQLLAQNAQTSRELADAVGALVRSRETFTAAAEPLPIGAIKFWQSTGGTIVAIRRGQTVILSPGPYAELYAGDVVVLVGSPAAAQAARHLLMEQLPAPAAGGAATP